VEELLREFTDVFPENLPDSLPPDRSVSPQKVEHLLPQFRPYTHWPLASLTAKNVAEPNLSRKELRPGVRVRLVTTKASPWRGAARRVKNLLKGEERLSSTFGALEAQIWSGWRARRRRTASRVGGKGAMVDATLRRK
jgi:hypothetical protein